MDRRDDDRQNGGGGLSARFGDVSVQLIAVGTIALIGTCIRVLAGMDVIQTQIAGLVKSDTRQDTLIEQVRTEMNTMRVQIGILREITRNNAGRP